MITVVTPWLAFAAMSGDGEQRTVVVGVHIDEPGRDDLAGDIDLARPGRVFATWPDRDNAVAGDRHIGAKARRRRCRRSRCRRAGSSPSCPTPPSGNIGFGGILACRSQFCASRQIGAYRDGREVRRGVKPPHARQ